MTPKVSIIIPIYNVEKYIGRCLQSVVGQSFYDIEIICVDDCSPDNSLQIVQKYAKQDKRIKIIKNQKNLRLGKTREAGFFASNGEYVTFVDSDDTICFDYIEKLYDKAKQTDAEVVKGNTMLIFSDGSTAIKPENSMMQKLLKDGKYLFLANFHDLTNLLINRNFMLKNNIMPDNINGDDCCAVRIFYYAKNTHILDDAIYYYWYGQDTSFSNKIINESSFKIRFDYVSSQIKLVNSFSELDKKTYIAFVKQHLENAYGSVRRICQHTDAKWKDLIANEFIRVINEEIQLTKQEKEKYIFIPMSKNIANAIKIGNAKLLVKLAQGQPRIVSKFAKPIANILSSMLILKAPRKKIRNKILGWFHICDSLFVASQP